MGKAVCFANWMLRGEDTNWKPGHRFKENCDFSALTAVINEFFISSPKTEKVTFKITSQAMKIFIKSHK